MTIQFVSRANTFFSSVHLRRLSAGCRAMFEEMRARNATRRTLGRISDRQLRDAGLIRNDIEAASHHPLSQPFGAELRAIARGRIGNW